MRVDAHHHLWRYTPEEFSWIGEDSAMLRRDFLPADLKAAMASAGVGAAVAVQARCSLEETEFLLHHAENCLQIAGVVGWAPLRSFNLSETLDRLSAYPCFVGLREITQDQPPGTLLDTDFNRGIRELTRRGLTYDILVRAGQLEETSRFVDGHPQQPFVVDHAAKPLIAQGLLQPWKTHIRELAQRPNVLCKLSGLVTEANWSRWSETDLRPFLDICLEAFGPGRCMAGSDWPVCLAASSYAQWWQVLEHWAAPLSADQQEQIFGLTASSFYGLQSGASAPASERSM